MKSLRQMQSLPDPGLYVLSISARDWSFRVKAGLEPLVVTKGRKPSKEELSEALFDNTPGWVVDLLYALVEMHWNDVSTVRVPVHWTKPTSYKARFTEAVALLCGKVPPESMVDDWIARKESSDGDGLGGLQSFAISNGPSWAQGIGLLDAAHLAASQPVEGVGHDE